MKKLQISWLNRLGPKENSLSPFEKSKYEFLLISMARVSRLDISDLLLYSLKREHQVYQKHHSIISISHIVQKQNLRHYRQASSKLSIQKIK